MIKLVRIDGKNIEDVLKLKAGDLRRSFDVSIEHCIIEAYIVQNAGGKALPFALYDEDIPVGFCMIGYGGEGFIESGHHRSTLDGYHIQHLMIDEGYRGKGYEKAALGAILDLICTRPYGPADFCHVSYRAEDREADELFGGVGFAETNSADTDLRTAVLDLRYCRKVHPSDEDRYLDGCVQNESITRSSGIFEKIQLFMSLFSGREDVYAKRWVNHHTGRSGYSPACRNEWVSGICRKPCSKCPSASYYLKLPTPKTPCRRDMTGISEG